MGTQPQTYLKTRTWFCVNLWDFRSADELPVLQDILRARVRACHRQLLWRLLVVQVPKHFLLLLSDDVELKRPPPLFGEEWGKSGVAWRNRYVAQNHPEFSNHTPGLTKIVLKLFYDQFCCMQHWRRKRKSDLDYGMFQVATDFLGAEEAFEDQILAIEAEAITLAERIWCEILNF